MSDKKSTSDEQKQHQQKMQELKQQVDAGIKAAKDKKGLLLVITGEGKGKSTSAFGTVARAVGHGLTTEVIQFIKGQWKCGERNLLQNVGVKFHVMATGFTWNTQDKQADIQAANEVWLEAKKCLQNESVDLVVLDEMTYMLAYEYLPLEEVLAAIKNRPVMQHVIVTGRNCHQDLLDMADTISEVKSVRHAFDHGIKAQKGIDW